MTRIHRFVLPALTAIAPLAAPLSAGTRGPGADDPTPVYAAGGGSDRKVHIGAQASWGDDTDFGLGARLVWSASEWRDGLEIVASADLFFPDDSGGADRSYFELNGNLIWNFNADSVTPYFGAGLNLARASVEHADGRDTSDTDLGLNLLGGLKLHGLLDGPLPYLEGRFTIEGADQFTLTVGLLF